MYKNCEKLYISVIICIEIIHVIRDMYKNPIINTPLLEQICSRIRDIQTSVRRHQVKIQNPTTKQIIYTRPIGYENIVRLLTNLEHFINEDNGLQPQRNNGTWIA